jgi:hypothetical protein
MISEMKLRIRELIIQTSSNFQFYEMHSILGDFVRSIEIFIMPINSASTIYNNEGLKEKVPIVLWRIL